MTTTPETISDFDAPIWGIENFAKIINRSERQTYHLVATGKLPGVNKVGDRYVSTRRKLLNAVLGEAV
ncbi:hypothetical protein [Mesorhizobium sp. WSM4887]|uniref:hypothetical protein n=1 Tax=Mesorhizobium sp. WSM4887 TaxID=3038543 RepID=UPI002415C2A1|nr:hypothetical protein [Mesorhizobium sp. WSM4887]MDG4889275.1 hypothetical protein [Mesorhizobium sp. WSM4887]